MLPEDHSVTVQNSVLGCNFFATKINNSFTHTVGTVFTNADIQFHTSTTITIKNIPVHSGFHGPHPSPWPQAASEPISISTIANRMLFHKWSHRCGPFRPACLTQHDSSGFIHAAVSVWVPLGLLRGLLHHMAPTHRIYPFTWLAWRVFPVRGCFTSSR